MEGYESRIVDGSNKELTKRDQLRLMDFTNAIKLDEEIGLKDELHIKPVEWAKVEVYNPKSKGETNYTKFIVVDADGCKWQTGSASFMEAFLQIFNFMDGEEFEISCYGVESKNYPGRKFLTCSVL